MAKNTVVSAREVMRAFLEEFTLAGSFDNPSLMEKFDRTYKRYHALLIWHANLVRAGSFSRNVKNKTILRSYVTECTSDISLSLFLFYQGLYKPAHLILRSSIENFMRVVGLVGNHDVLKIDHVYELKKTVQESSQIFSNTTARMQFNLLAIEYERLCKFVHTSDLGHMAHTVFVGVYPYYKEDEATRFSNCVLRVMAAISAIYCTLEGGHLLRRLHHQEFDIIMDSLSRSVRKRLNE